MTDEMMPLLERLQKRGGGDFLKDLAEAVLQRLMEFEVEGLVAPVATSGATAAPRIATATVSGIWRPGSARSS